MAPFLPRTGVTFETAQQGPNPTSLLPGAIRDHGALRPEECKRSLIIPFIFGGARSAGGTPVLSRHQAVMCKTERELLIPFHYLHRWGMKTAHSHLTLLACSLLTLPEGQGYRWASTAPPERHSLMGGKQLKEQRECAHKTHPNEDKRRD
jgi:hypothetical protein